MIPGFLLTGFKLVTKKETQNEFQDKIVAIILTKDEGCHIIFLKQKLFYWLSGGV